MIIIARELGTNKRFFYNEVKLVDDVNDGDRCLLIKLCNNSDLVTTRFYAEELYIGQIIEAKVIKNENFVVLYQTKNGHYVIENVI